MTTKNIEAIYPLSPMQEGMLFHTLYDPGSNIYFEQLDFTLRGRLDGPAFKRAWQRVVDRHPILRTLFLLEREKPLQVVRRQVELPWRELDWRGEADQAQKLADFLAADRAQGFDLAAAPVMRLALIRLAEARYHFCWSFHHALLDGWSSPILLEELFTLYQMGEEANLPPPPPYRRYIEWLQKQDLAEAETFWRERLRGLTAPTRLRLDGSILPPGAAPRRYDERELTLSAETSLALQSWARQQRITLNILFQAAWALLLSRYSGQADVIFGATLSGRPAELPGIERMAGLFINTLPVRIQIPPDKPLAAWLKELQERQAELQQYEYTPLPRLQQWSDIPAGQPLFESIIVFENFPVSQAGWGRAESLTVEDVRYFERTNYPVAVTVSPAGERLRLHIGYDSDRFEGAMIERVLGHMQTLLAGLAADPATRPVDLPMLTEAERHQQLVAWNDVRADYPADRCIHHLFEDQAARQPEAIALIDPARGDQLTYAELDRQANQLAHHLQTLGVGPERLVGLYAGRSPEMIVGLLATLKAGGAYVPLDPAYPPERLAWMLEDSRAAVLLTQPHLVASLPPHQAQLVHLSDDFTAYPPEKPELEIPVRPDNLAYVIYTSGSTGRPKGTMIEHRSLVNYTTAARLIYDITPADRVLQFASISFDLSAEEIYASLVNGAALILRTDEMLASAAAFIDRCRDWQLSLVSLPTAYWHELAGGLAAGELSLPPSLRMVIVGGEKLLPAYIELWQRHVEPAVRLINTYGPTEATIIVSHYEIAGPLRPGEEIPIGRPVSNTQLYVLDRSLRPVPVGAPGELHIGGDCLARGYLNRPEATAARFIPHPFEAESRLYKTGDMVRYRPDGQLEFVGRVDHQVKVRGFRVELGEIETVLGQHPAVQEAVVLARPVESGGNRLAAYIVPGPTPPDIEAVRRFLEERLPDYMIPAAFMFLEVMPLTAGGKVDRAALPDIEGGEPGRGFVAPRNPVELQLVRIWQEVLDRQPVGVRDNFFDLGGHSLLVMRLMARIQKQFGRQLSLAAIFRSPTIEALAAALSGESDYSPLVPIQPEGDRPPFFCVHAGGGTVLYYRELAEALGRDQPFYGLQAPGLSGEQPPLDRIEALAARYIEAMRTVQPGGPYYLGGWCIGGTIAFEMAHQLRRQGETVALLALIDSEAPLPAPEPPGLDRAMYLFWFLLDLGDQFGRDLAITVEELRELEPEAQLAHALDRARAAQILPAETGPDQFRGLLEVYIANLRASHSYQPHLYDGSITLLVAEQPLSQAPSGTYRDPQIDWGEFVSWQQFSRQPAQTYTIPGNHYTILTRPYVHELAERLQTRLG